MKSSNPGFERGLGVLGGFVLLVFCAAAVAEVTVVDDAGRTVSLAGPAERIVSLAPHVTELLFSAGAGEKIVGAVQWSDYPPGASGIPRVGDTYSVDLERIVALTPDLIVAWQSGNSALTVGRLVDAGFTVFVSEPHSLEDIGESILRLGKLAGTAKHARAGRDAFLRRLRGLRESARGARPVSVFYQVWDNPIFTVNGRHIISEVLNLCGGRNVFADLPALSTQVGREAVLAANPQAIIASGAGPERPPWLDNWNRWASMTAVRKGSLFHVPPELLQRHTARILDGAERVCEILQSVRGEL